MPLPIKVGVIVVTWFQEVLRLFWFSEIGWWLMFLNATMMTVFLSVTGFALGAALGILLATAHILGPCFLRSFTSIYSTLFRGVPDLFIIYLLYFVGSTWLTTAYQAVGGTGFIVLPTVAVGVLSLGVISSAFQMEVYRGAYLAIDKGQLQAGIACGMGKSLLFRRIIFPQALQYALPAMGNLWQLILKDSALISVIGVVELMRQAQIAAGSTHMPFLFYTAAASIYLLITIVSKMFFKLLERRTKAAAHKNVRH